MYDITWLLRGAQSAVFYYVSCSPYTRRRNRRRRAKEVEEDRQARQHIESRTPGLYRQPSPYRRNEFWEEDIQLGPDRSNRRKGKKSKQPEKRQEMEMKSEKAIQEPSPAMVAAAAAAAEPPIQRQPLGRLDETKTDKDASVDHSHSTAHQMAEQAVDNMKNFVRNAAESSKQRWNNIRYQRADEELWGLGYQSTNQSSVRQAGMSSKASSLHPASSVTGHSHSLLRLPTLSKSATMESSTDSFFVPRAPPVNELHPPVVSQPVFSKTANSWMKQPPPPASVMGGFVDPLSASAGGPRSRSGSGTNSGLNSRTGSVRQSKQNREEGLQRQISTKLMDGKINPDTNKQAPGPISNAPFLTVPSAAHLRHSSSDPNISAPSLASNLVTPKTHNDRTSSQSSSDDQSSPRTPVATTSFTTASHDFAIPSQTVLPITTQRHKRSNTLQRTHTASEIPLSPHTPIKIDMTQSSTLDGSKRKPRNLKIVRSSDAQQQPTAAMSPETQSAFLFHYPYPLVQGKKGAWHVRNDDDDDVEEDYDEDEYQSEAAQVGISNSRRWSVDF